MEQEIQVLPVRCKGCGSMFDLWHVLQEQESKGVISGNQGMSRFLKQSLCTRCQQTLRMELEEEELDVESDETPESESDIVLGFE